jgi:Holliday junction resolvasome RuvABC endonuclease subunit
MDNPLWIESAIQGHAGNVQTTVKMAQTQGMIMATHWGPCTVVAPSSWKAGIGAGGRADKEEVKEWLKRTHPDLFDVCATQDEVDAMCLSLYGIMVSGGLHGQEG